MTEDNGASRGSTNDFKGEIEFVQPGLKNSEWEIEYLKKLKLALEVGEKLEDAIASAVIDSHDVIVEEDSVFTSRERANFRKLLKREAEIRQFKELRALSFNGYYF